MVPTLSMLIFMVAIVAFQPSAVLGGDAGIVYGRNGDNLPSPKRVIDFLTNDMHNSISLIRLYDTNLEVLEALSGTNLVVTLGVPNEAIAHVASSQEAADSWVQDHIITYISKGVRFRYVCVGNEAIPGVVASLVLKAIENLHTSIRQKGIDYIFVTTAVGYDDVVTTFDPPSTAMFAYDVAEIMGNVTSFLCGIGSPLLINVYPYFTLLNQPRFIPLEFALFRSKSPVITDGDLEYYNLFDAMVDAFIAAIALAVHRDDVVKVVVSESGWPTGGDKPHAGIENARIYNTKLREHAIGRGVTPRKADINLEVYIYSMFNENLRGSGVDQNFGTFYPNLTEVYPMWH